MTEVVPSETLSVNGWGEGGREGEDEGPNSKRHALATLGSGSLAGLRSCVRPTAEDDRLA
jgi:hypothetical protein